jgi:folate-dependent phosphoribosylglycinamide formyltransferase PurN
VSDELTAAEAGAADRDPDAEIPLLFLCPADAVKSRVVLDWFLTASGSLDRNYRPGVVLDSAEGRAAETARAAGLPRRIATDPSDPLSAVEGVATELGGCDYLVSCGWGHWIPETVIETADTALNCHGSYLPDYRGPSPHRIQWANGKRHGGATVHRLTESFDDGAILARERFAIGPRDTPLDILRRASELTAVLLAEALLLDAAGNQGTENEGGRYFSLADWPTVLFHGVPNRVLWLLGSDYRWEIPAEPRD